MSTTQPTPATGSTQQKVPARPKWPNVLAEPAGAVQCGALLPRISKPRPQGLGSWGPKPGSTPARSGNAGLVASANVAVSTSVGSSSSPTTRARSAALAWAPWAGEAPTGSAVAPSPRGSTTASCR